MADPILPAAPYCVPSSASPEERARIIAARAREALTDPSVQAAARGIACANCQPRERAAAVLRRAQAAGFVADPPGCDAYAPVAHTLAHGGDCDDLTPLVMALGTLTGFGARVAYLSQPDEPQDHVTGMLLVDGEWLWAEPSVRGARLGEHPYDAARRTGQLASYKGTGSFTGVADGVVANLLTLGLLGVAAYFGARAGARGNPEPRRELAWRTRQPHGAIMRARTFDRIERQARARGYDDPQAVAGSAYWRTVRAKYRDRPRRNPAPDRLEEYAVTIDMGSGRTERSLSWTHPGGNGESWSLIRDGDESRFRFGPGSGYAFVDDPTEIVWHGDLDERPLNKEAMRELGVSGYLRLQQMRERFAELKPSDFVPSEDISLG